MIFNPTKKKEVWRFLTYMFVHSGYFHITFNVLIQVCFWGIKFLLWLCSWCLIFNPIWQKRRVFEAPLRKSDLSKWPFGSEMQYLFSYSYCWEFKTIFGNNQFPPFLGVSSQLKFCSECYFCWHFLGEGGKSKKLRLY